jgi:hypothetical protein
MNVDVSVGVVVLEDEVSYSLDDAVVGRVCAGHADCASHAAADHVVHASVMKRELVYAVFDLGLVEESDAADVAAGVDCVAVVWMFDGGGPRTRKHQVQRP